MKLTPWFDGSMSAYKYQIEALRAECVSLKHDAERYRWLKARKSLTLTSDGTLWRRPDGTSFVSSHYLAADGTQHAAYEALDETIDAARKEETK